METEKNLSIFKEISRYVRLDKVGKNYRGICPFHEERTPSFSVSLEKGIYKCFGCGSSGNVSDFIEKISDLNKILVLNEMGRRRSGFFLLNGSAKIESFTSDEIVISSDDLFVLELLESPENIEFIRDSVYCITREKIDVVFKYSKFKDEIEDF